MKNKNAKMKRDEDEKFNKRHDRTMRLNLLID